MSRRSVIPRRADRETGCGQMGATEQKQFDDGQSDAIVECQSRGKVGFSEDETERVSAEGHEDIEPASRTAAERHGFDMARFLNIIEPSLSAAAGAHSDRSASSNSL
jgi:hypothetical protein